HADDTDHPGGRLPADPAFFHPRPGRDRRRQVILAVDGGNSKTDLALVDSDGRLLAALRGPTTSHQQIGFEPGIERMAGLGAELPTPAGLTPDTPAAEVGVYGLAGADTPADTRRLAAALGGRGLAT